MATILCLSGCASYSTHALQTAEGGDWVFIHGHPPGKPPYFLSPDILARLYPQIANPRVPSVEDIGDETDQWHFIAGGFSFVLFGDFNQDGLYDVALVGNNREERDPGSVMEIYDKLADTVDFVVSHQDYFDAPRDIYGSFQELGDKIRAAYKSYKENA
jgi:hypothetical protein